jgi:uncharacterized membrane protein
MLVAISELILNVLLEASFELLLVLSLDELRKLDFIFPLFVLTLVFILPLFEAREILLFKLLFNVEFVCFELLFVIVIFMVLVLLFKGFWRRLALPIA